MRRQKLKFQTVDNNSIGNYNPSAFRFKMFPRAQKVIGIQDESVERRKKFLCESHPFILKGCSCQTQIIVT